LVLGAFIFTGCSFAPKYSQPSVQTPVAFKETNGWKVAEPKEDTLRASGGNIQRHQPEHARRTSRCFQSTVAVAFANFLAARAWLSRRVRSFSDHYCQSVGHALATVRLAKPIEFQFFHKEFFGNASTITEYALPFDASWEWISGAASAIQSKPTRAKLKRRSQILKTCGSQFMQNSRRTIFSFGRWRRRASLRCRNACLSGVAQAYSVRHDTGIASDQDVAQAETQLNHHRRASD